MSEIPHDERYLFEAHFHNTDAKEFSASHQMTEGTCDRYDGIFSCWEQAITHFANSDPKVLKQFERKRKEASNYHEITDIEVSYMEDGKRKHIMCEMTNYPLIG